MLHRVTQAVPGTHSLCDTGKGWSTGPHPTHTRIPRHRNLRPTAAFLSAGGGGASSLRLCRASATSSSIRPSTAGRHCSKGRVCSRRGCSACQGWKRAADSWQALRGRADHHVAASSKRFQIQPCSRVHRGTAAGRTPSGISRMARLSSTACSDQGRTTGGFCFGLCGLVRDQKKARGRQRAAGARWRRHAAAHTDQDVLAVVAAEAVVEAGAGVLVVLERDGVGLVGGANDRKPVGAGGGEVCRHQAHWARGCMDLSTAMDAP